VHHIALMKHFRQCVTSAEPPEVGPSQGVDLMQMIDAIYKSAATGKSAEVRQ
jgi:predicted dehydrogenase